MDKNYWKTDNENGYKYQFMAVANAIRAVHTKKVKNIELKGISWIFVDEYLCDNSLKYDCSLIFDNLFETHNVYIPVYDIKENKYVDLYFNIITGNLYIFLKDE
jgi:hypothetical protein